MPVGREQKLGPVYVFDNVNVTLGGKAYCLSSMTILLKENSIPTIRLTVDPYHVPGDATTPATPGDLPTILKWHDELQQLAATQGAATLSVNIKRNTVLEQFLELEDWVVTGAGITGASASGSFSLAVEIQHPLARCDYSSLNLGSFVKKTDIKSSNLDQKNILTALTSAFDKYIEPEISETSYTIACNGSKTEVTNDVIRMKAKLKKAVKALKDHLEWNPTFILPECRYDAWPAQACLRQSVPPLAMAVADYVRGISDISIWELLTHRVCGHWSLSIIPTYWSSSLILAPYTPWAEPAISIEDRDIADITFPGIDPAIVAGVYAQHQAPAVGGNYSSYANGGQDKIFSVEGMAYVPSDELDGRILRLSSPHWLQAYIVEDSTIKTPGTSPSNATETKGSERGAVSPSSPYSTFVPSSEDPTKYLISADEARGALYKAAEQMFLERFKAEVKVTLRTKTLIELPGSTFGGYIIPGQVCQVTSGLQDSDKAIFEFYITEVIHTIDFQNDVTQTQIGGGYARPPGGFPGIVESGTCNPLYAK